MCTERRGETTRWKTQNARHPITHTLHKEQVERNVGRRAHADRHIDGLTRREHDDLALPLEVGRVAVGTERTLLSLDDALRVVDPRRARALLRIVERQLIAKEVGRAKEITRCATRARVTSGSTAPTAAWRRDAARAVRDQLAARHIVAKAVAATVALVRRAASAK